MAIRINSVKLFNITCCSDATLLVDDCTFGIILEDENELDPYTYLRVDCYHQTDCEEGDIRLVNGYSSHHGVVEICIQGLWGGISITKADGIRDPFVVFGWDAPNAK